MGPGNNSLAHGIPLGDFPGWTQPHFRVTMSLRDEWRVWIVLTVAAVGVIGSLFVPRIPQDPAYHQFVDDRTLLGIPNFWNVVTNISFVLVGIFGFARLSRIFALRTSYLLVCIGIILVGAGSAYYHFSPSTKSLVWDRLPMTIVFMALFSAIIEDRVSDRAGKILLWPLIVVGAASVGYWHLSELQGNGDLRPYGLVQFLPLVLIPLILVLFPSRGLRTSFLWWTLITYALAIITEHFDLRIFETTGIISGHSIKHLLASLALLFFVLAYAGATWKEAWYDSNKVSSD